MAGSAWTNQIQNTVIVAGPTGTITGFFVYSGTPGTGNAPVGSWTIPGTTVDPFGNSILPDFVVGQNTSGQVQIIPGNPSAIVFPVTGSWESFPAIAAASSSEAFLQISSGSDLTGKDSVILTLESGIAGSGANFFLAYIDSNGGENTQIQSNFTGLFLPAVTEVLAVAPGTGTSRTNPASPESWHGMSLANGWGNDAGQVTAQYRLVASPPNSVEIIGAITATSASSSTFFTLPSAYQPASNQQIPAGATGGVTTAKAPFITCSSAGVLSTNNVTIGAANIVIFHGTISLDA